jgi:phosphoglycerate dehydrogenase-like enzyme
VKQVYSAGVERYAFAELRASKVVLTNAKVIQGPNVADHAMALLLALTRGIPQAVAQQSLRRWAKQDLRDGGHLIELEGRTAVVVGLGGIGTAIARRAVGFGMTVVGVDPDTSPRPGLVETVLAPERMAEALPRADVLFLAVPLTPATERMIGATQLAALPRGGYLVNVSRGRIVDTDALIRVLREGRLGGAGLDVTDPEPLPADHPLWAMPNVLVTPHLAGSSDRVTERRIELLRDNLARFLAGRPLRNVVDKDKGY